jgi:predicted acylesterase/phospholipase RssA
MSTALVISGGGSRGAFAVGAVEELLSRGYRFDIIAGTSTGALIAPLLAIGDIEELVRLYTTVRTKDILRWNWRRLFRGSIYDTAPLERLIRRTMQGERYARLMKSQVKVLLCSVGFQTGEVRYLTQHLHVLRPNVVAWAGFNEYVSATLASTNQPMLMPPVMVHGQVSFDGGVREVAPLRVVSELGATEIVVIANSPSEPSLAPYLYTRYKEIGPRSVDLMTTEILNNDLACIPGKVTVIRPTAPLPSSGLEFVPSEMQEMREMGQRRAEEVLG